MGLTIKKVYFTVILKEVYFVDSFRRERGDSIPDNRSPKTAGSQEI